MASATQIVRNRRKMKKAAAGRKRKNALAIKGSTQRNLALNVPNANEVAQKKALAALK